MIDLNYLLMFDGLYNLFTVVINYNMGCGDITQQCVKAINIWL